jgi:2'-5' RNA ligase
VVVGWWKKDLTNIELNNAFFRTRNGGMFASPQGNSTWHITLKMVGGIVSGFQRQIVREVAENASRQFKSE